MSNQTWNPTDYSRHASFVVDMAADMVDLLAPPLQGREQLPHALDVGADGLAVLAAARASRSTPPVVLLTAYGTITQAVAFVGLLLGTAYIAGHAARERWLRERDLNTLHEGGVFAGRTPHNVVLNGADLDEAIDAGMLPAA